MRKQENADGDHMRPQRGNSGETIRRNFSRKDRLKALADFYRQNAHKYPDSARDFFKHHPNL